MKLPVAPGPRRFIIAWCCVVACLVLVTAFVHFASVSLADSAIDRIVNEMKGMPQVQMQVQQMLRQGASQEQVIQQLRSYAGQQADIVVAGMRSASLRTTVIAFLATIVLYIALVMRRLQRSDRRVLAGAAVVLLLVDLGYVAHKYILPDPTPLLLDKTGAILKLEQVKEPFRVKLLSRSDTTLLGLYGIECIDVPADSRPTPDRTAFFYSGALSPLCLWQYSNVRFLLAPKDPKFDAEIRQMGGGMVVPFHEYAEDGQPRVIYEYTAALPRVFAVGSWIVATNAPDILAFMDNPSNDPHQVAVVCDAAVTPRSVSNFSSSAIITNYTPERVEALVNLPHNGLVVMATEPDPGWSVTVDGAAQKLVRCNLLHQGVFVPAGTHTVVFSFSTDHWTNILNDWAYRALPVLLLATVVVLVVGARRSGARPA